MVYYLIISVASALFSVSLFWLATPFFHLAERTLSLLNSLLDQESEEAVKHRQVTQKLDAELRALLLFLVSCVLAIAIAMLPVYLYARWSSLPMDQLDTHSWKFWVSLILGGLLPFGIAALRPRRGEDYTEWSKLLHRLVLDNYHFSRKLFRLERSMFSSKTAVPSEEFIIVTGLARAGTTALTKLLHRVGSYYSLSYANMPFLLSPNLWRRVYRPKSQAVRERSHGDQVTFGLTSVEALEEHFFKNFLNDNFINDQYLEEHTVDEETYQKYLVYQGLLRPTDDPKSKYLAKNNNFLLRYASLRALNASFKVVCLFRDPVDHAYSLLKQHQRFSALQQDTPFVVEYMDWLGHHEFGVNHKPFRFSDTPRTGDHSPESINYWLSNWIDYYRRVLQIDHDANFLLVDYSDFSKRPADVLSELAHRFQQPLDTSEVVPFENKNQYQGPIDSSLVNTAREIHQQLVSRKLSVAR